MKIALKNIVTARKTTFIKHELSVSSDKQTISFAVFRHLRELISDLKVNELISEFNIQF